MQHVELGGGRVSRVRLSNSCLNSLSFLVAGRGCQLDKEFLALLVALAPAIYFALTFSHLLGDLPSSVFLSAFTPNRRRILAPNLKSGQRTIPDTYNSSTVQFQHPAFYSWQRPNVTAPWTKIREHYARIFKLSGFSIGL